MEVISIQFLNRKQKKIILDTGFSFVLYLGEIRKLGLKEGEALEESTFQDICQLLFKRGLQRSLYLLEKKDRSRGEILTTLKKSGYPLEIIQEIIEKLEGWRLVDDLEYAQSYIRQYKDKKSYRQIYEYLYRKGISREVCQEIVDDEQEGQEELIDSLIQKKLKSLSNRDNKDKMRLQRYLLSKGFSYDAIASGIAKIWEDE